MGYIHVFFSFLSFLSSLLTNLTSLVLSFDILFVITVQSVPEGEKGSCIFAQTSGGNFKRRNIINDTRRERRVYDGVLFLSF